MNDESAVAVSELSDRETWVGRVEFGDEFALVVEWPGARPHDLYWWVLCPASATLITDAPAPDDDPTSPDDHGACSLGLECDFWELHALAHEAIRTRMAALNSPTPTAKGDA